MKRTGIMGGTFDPIHIGHLTLAAAAAKELNLDEVLFMPAHIPPHKQDLAILDEAHRLRMVELAIEGYPGFLVSDMELRMQGASYTARTLTELKKTHESLVFIMGADSFLNLGSWYMPEVIFSKAEIACAVRDETTISVLRDLAEQYHTQFQGISHILHMEYVDISSSEIRKRLRDGEEEISEIPKKVMDYIREHGLYKE